MGHPNLGLKLPPNNDAKHSPAYGPNSLRARESRSTHLAHRPTPRYVHPRPQQPRSDLHLARGSLSRALCGPSARGKLRLARAPLGRLRRRPNHPMGLGTFTRQLVRGVGRVSDGVGRRQLASATMPHSERDRHLLNLRPPLCRYSRRGAGLRRTVRTCLSPSATVPPTLCTFPLARPLAGVGGNPRTQYEPRPKQGRRLQHPRRPTPSDAGLCALLQLSPRC